MCNQVYELTEMAVQCGQLKQLLLGSSGYGYLPKYSPAHRTDLALVIPHGLHQFQRNCHDSVFSNTIVNVLLELACEYDGIMPAAGFILVESCFRVDRNSPFYFSLEPIAVVLRNSIEHFRDKLSMDHTAEGENWPDGRYGCLRNLARNTVCCGGPDFFGLERWRMRFS